MQPHPRAVLRPAADEACQAGGHAGRGLRDLAREQPQRALVVVHAGDLHHHFTGGGGSGVRAVGGFRAQHLDIGLAQVGEAGLAEQAAHTGEDGLRDAFTFARCVDAADDEGGGDAVAIEPGGAAFVGGGGRHAARTGHAHAVRTDLLERHLREIADHVRQQVGARIADLVEQLLADRVRRDETARSFRLGDDEAAVGLALDDREPHVLVARHRRPVGEVAAGALRAALDDVAGERALREPIVVVG